MRTPRPFAIGVSSLYPTHSFGSVESDSSHEQRSYHVGLLTADGRTTMEGRLD